MELANAEKTLQNLELPDWVLDRMLVEDINEDNEPFVRVRLKVADDFDVDKHFDEIMNTGNRIREALWECGIPSSTQIHFGITDDAPTV